MLAVDRHDLVEQVHVHRVFGQFGDEVRRPALHEVGPEAGMSRGCGPARGKRLAGTEPGILESITEGLGSGIVRMDVKGDIYDPEITTKTLPVLEATLGILGGQDEDTGQ